MLDYQKYSGQSLGKCKDCKIVISDSNFTHTNFNKRIRAIRPLYDYTEGNRFSSRYDSSGLAAGAVLVPLFQNYGSIINVEDFEGPIEFKGCTVDKNLIGIKDL